MRTCGECNLCCKLLPVVELEKGANTRCKFQRHHKGCSVYNKPAMPACCSMWSCRWLVEDRTEGMKRPDRAGYVIDILPDFVKVRDELTGAETPIPVLQVWVDPLRSGAWRKDPAFMAYLERLGAEEGMAALIRNGSEEAVFVAPPAINPTHEWFFQDSNVSGPTHRAKDFIEAGFSMDMVMEARP